MAQLKLNGVKKEPKTEEQNPIMSRIGVLLMKFSDGGRKVMKSILRIMLKNISNLQKL